MDKATPTVITMTDMEYYQYMASCDELKGKLDQCINFLMHYIFEGKCKDRGQWESLFYGLTRAVFIKEYLQLYMTNVGCITEDFLTQFEEWHAELTRSIN